MRSIVLLILLAGPTPIPVPAGEGGIGFDDLVFSGALGRFIVPGGRTGSVFFLDPGTERTENAAEPYNLKAQPQQCGNPGDPGGATWA